MSGLEVVGIRASLAAAISAFGQSFVIYGSNNRDYGYIRGFALETVFFQARSVVERIRRHVIESSGDGAKEALSVKESYATSFNMIAVAVSY